MEHSLEKQLVAFGAAAFIALLIMIFALAANGRIEETKRLQYTTAAGDTVGTCLILSGGEEDNACIAEGK